MSEIMESSVELRGCVFSRRSASSFVVDAAISTACLMTPRADKTTFGQLPNHMEISKIHS